MDVLPAHTHPPIFPLRDRASPVPAPTAGPPVKERTDAVWCTQCGRRPTWAAAGVCFRCRHGLTDTTARPELRLDAEFTDFATVSPWPAALRFSLVILAAQIVVSTPVVFGGVAAGTGAMQVLGQLILVVLSGTASATAGFMAAWYLSEPFYMPLRRALGTAAWVSAATSALSTLIAFCMPVGAGLDLGRDVLLPALTACVASAIILEVMRSRGLRAVRQFDTCLSCGHLLRGTSHKQCPECGGPILRSRVLMPPPEPLRCAGCGFARTGRGATTACPVCGLRQEAPPA